MNKTLLVDGFLNLKRNHYKRLNIKDNQGNYCGGTFGFLDSLRVAINRVMPDRVVVMWDGFNAGKYRYDFYKPYKANKQKNWELEKQILYGQNYGIPNDNETLVLFRQKEKIQEYLDELSIRQVQVDYIEADDLIGLYCLRSPGQEIVIMSRDGDYLQLIDNNVSVLTPDSLLLVTKNNFFNTYGYTHENALLIKSFKGDKSDGIKGILGVSEKKLLENFPNMKKEKYFYPRLVDEAYSKKEKQKGRSRFFDKIINSEAELYRNAKLMNLKKPFINQQAVDEIMSVSRGPMSSDESRSISEAMTMFVKNGFQRHFGQGVDFFFRPYYRVQMKEKEYIDYYNNLKEKGK